MCSRVFYYCCLSATLSAVTATYVQACLILAILRDTGQHACTLHSLHNRLRFLECTSPTLHLINTTAPRSSACCRSIQLNKVWRLALLSLDNIAMLQSEGQGPESPFCELTLSSGPGPVIERQQSRAPKRDISLYRYWLYTRKCTWQQFVFEKMKLRARDCSVFFAQQGYVSTFGIRIL